MPNLKKVGPLSALYKFYKPLICLKFPRFSPRNAELPDAPLDTNQVREILLASQSDNEPKIVSL